LHDPDVDLESGAREAHALGFRERDLRLPLAIQIGELPLAGAVGVRDAELRRRRRIRRGEREANSVRRRRDARDPALAVDDASQPVLGLTRSVRGPLRRRRAFTHQRVLHGGIGQTGFATAASGGNTIFGWRSWICATIAFPSTLSCLASNLTPWTSSTCSAFRSVATSAFWMACDSTDFARFIASASTWIMVM